MALRAAASCFGNPDERSANDKPAAISTWNGTAVWKERAPAVANDLPFILDDTKQARDAADVATTIYKVTQGRGKGRGTEKGVAGQASFRTVMLSSGEQAATSFTQDGGTLGRVITVWGSPFGTKNREVGSAVRRMNEQILRHYGHAGPRFVQYLLANKHRWDRWRKMYQKLVDHWEECAQDNAIAGRLAPYFAALGVAAYLAHKALDLPWQHEDPITPLWEDLVREAGDRAAAALRHTVDWAHSHVEDFCGRRSSNVAPPVRGWAGRWDRGSKDNTDDGQWPWIAFYPNRLNEILNEGGFEHDSTVRTWKDRGWLLTDKDPDGTVRTGRRTKVGVELPRLLVIRRDAIDAAERQA